MYGVSVIQGQNPGGTTMIVAGFKFAVGIGIGCVLLLFAAVFASAIIFRFERIAYRRGWMEEPARAMPKTRASTVVPFSPRPTAFPARSRADS
jgi:hypothetical protein